MISEKKLRKYILIATVLHALVIFGVSFSNKIQSSKSSSMDVTIVTTKTDKNIDNAEYIANANQEASGTLEKEATLKTTFNSIFQSDKVHEAHEILEESSPDIETFNFDVIASLNSSDKVNLNLDNQLEFSSDNFSDISQNNRFSQEIASLRAQLAILQQEYAKRPKILRMNAVSTSYDISAEYKDNWRQKIEIIGNSHYPQRAKDEKITAQLRMLVILNRFGSLLKIEILQSSGYEFLDLAAIDIVRASAPFPEFLGSMENYDQLEIIRTWRFLSTGLETSP